MFGSVGKGAGKRLVGFTWLSVGGTTPLPGAVARVTPWPSAGATVGATGAAEKTMPVIPASAVQNMNNRQIVFAATDKPNVFIMKSVRLGTENNKQFVVLEGLNVGDKIVTDGSFLLRAELMKQNPTHQH